MRRAVSLVAWFALLEGLWLVFVGTRQTTELVAGLIAATAGALVAELLRSLGLGYRADLRLLAGLWRLPFDVVFDFGVVTWVLARALVRRRRVRGRWVTVPRRSVGGWERALAAVAGSATPNTIVVDVDGERALLHTLAPHVHTSESVP